MRIHRGTTRNQTFLEQEIGLFATQSIQAGTIVAYYPVHRTGVEFDEEDDDDHEDHPPADASFSVTLNSIEKGYSSKTTETHAHTTQGTQPTTTTTTTTVTVTAAAATTKTSSTPVHRKKLTHLEYAFAWYRSFLRILGERWFLLQYPTAVVLFR